MRMEEIVRSMDALVGQHVSGLCRQLEWDSIQLNWLLFQVHRQAVPHPGDWSVLLVDSRITVPPATAEILAASEIMRMVSWITMPSLMMTEVQGENYSLCSGWAFQGGLPEIDGRSNGMYSGVKRIRLMTTIDNYRGVALLSGEVRPGLVAILRMAESDGRHTISTWAIVDKNTQAVIATQTSFDRRWCDICLLTNTVCDPRVCNVESPVDRLREARVALLDKTKKPECNMQYLQMWMSGKWTSYLGPLDPVTIDWRSYVSGYSFKYALFSVVQIEVEGVHPPRSSFRLVQQAREEVDYFLNLEEEQGSRSLSEEEHMSRDLFEKLKAHEVSESARMKSELRRKPHQCETCGMAFKRAYDMKRHGIAVHNKVRDFKCLHCGRMFTQSGHMHEHVRVAHTGLNLHGCSECGKQFGTKSKLERHTRTVHKLERNFSCAVCKNSYSDKSYLKQHMVAKHLVNMNK
mmetsp:Transcript_12179/g.50432  ORF Transcript_12179/g.50432 Transcript_12179/m.50432 type:complete len:462 (-) Transcript_12179:141-1526(-)